MMKEFDEALELYEKEFGESFPMASMMTTEPSEVIEIINKCIAAKKDVYDMGYLSLDSIY